MRTFLAFVIVLCVFAGLYLLPGPDFYWPDRHDPSQALYLTGLSSRLLGLALLATAWLGIMAARQASASPGRAAPRRWQYHFFGLTLLVLALVSAAFHLAEPGPNPEARAHGGRQ